MSVHIKFGNYSKLSSDTLTQRVQFTLSPVNELFQSLHVLLNPKHHGQNLNWVLQIKNKISDEMYVDLQYFKILYELGTPSFLIPNLQSFSTDLDSEFNQLLVNLKHLDLEWVIQQVEQLSHERQNDFIPTLAKGIEWADFKPTPATNLIQDLKTNPQKVFDRFKCFLINYRQNIFDEFFYQNKIVSKLTAEIERETQLLQTGFQTLINDLQNDRIFWNNDEITITKPFDQTFNLENTGAILLLPSTFTWPHLFVSPYKNNVVINYGFESQHYASFKFDTLQKVFSALSDPIRLKILIQLFNQHQTTQTLTSIMNIGMSTVSRHLQILKEAGLIKSHRQGKFVFYEPTNLITNLIPNFFDYLL